MFENNFGKILNKFVYYILYLHPIELEENCNFITNSNNVHHWKIKFY